MSEGNFDEYDHDYEQITECAECGETHENCECEEYQPVEMEGVDECEECGLPKDDPQHGGSDS